MFQKPADAKQTISFTVRDFQNQYPRCILTVEINPGPACNHAEADGFSKLTNDKVEDARVGNVEPLHDSTTSVAQQQAVDTGPKTHDDEQQKDSITEHNHGGKRTRYVIVEDLLNEVGCRCFFNLKIGK